MVQWVVDAAGSDGSGSSTIAVAIGFVVLAAGLGVSAYRVSATRRQARAEGLDANAATKRALTGRDVSEPEPRAATDDDATGDAAARLTQLRSLLQQDLISQEEYDARRRAILDSI